MAVGVKAIAGFEVEAVEYEGVGIQAAVVDDLAVEANQSFFPSAA